MDQRKRHPQPISNCRGSLRATSIWTDYDRLLEIWDLVLNVFFQKRPPVQVIDGDIEEPLILGIMQVHRDDMVGAGAGEKVCNECTRLCDPLLVSRSRLEVVFLWAHEVVVAILIMRIAIGQG